MNYGQLKERISRRINRGDLTSALLEDFTEDALDRVARDLQIQTLEHTVQLEVSSGSVPVPSNFMKMKEIWCGTIALPESERLVYKTWSEWKRYSAAGTPCYYTRLGDRWYIRPTPADASTVTLVYYRDIPDLVNDSDLHPMLVVARDLIIYAACCAAGEHFEDERLPRWEAKYQETLASLSAMAVETETHEGTLAISPAYEEDY